MAAAGIIAAMIPAVTQIIKSISQNSMANKYANSKRPISHIPQGMLDAVDIQKNLALQSELPGQRVIEEKLDESGANALNTIKAGATSPWEAITGGQRINENITEKVKDLGIAGAEMQIRNKSVLSQMLEGLGKMQQENFMMNDFAPYLADMDAAKNLRTAGTKNMFSGLSNLSGMIAENPDMFKGLFEDGKSNGESSGFDESAFDATNQAFLKSINDQFRENNMFVG